MNGVPQTILAETNLSLTRHAWQRMSARRLSATAVRLVLEYGRIAHIRNATIYAVGRKEVARHRANGIELSSVEGVQVVCTEEGQILTVYRNQDLRSLRPRSRRMRRRLAS